MSASSFIGLVWAVGCYNDQLRRVVLALVHRCAASQLPFPLRFQCPRRTSPIRRSARLAPASGVPGGVEGREYRETLGVLKLKGDTGARSAWNGATYSLALLKAIAIPLCRLP
jgi:hypothetical protein